MHSRRTEFTTHTDRRPDSGPSPTRPAPVSPRAAMMLARPIATVAATALAAAAVVVVQGFSPTAPAAHAAPTWGPCPETVTSPGAVCTTVTVPQDYTQPAGEAIDVTVSKLPARDPGARRGALFGNAGGPGGDTLTYFDDNGLFAWPDALRDEWDLIGVQPRGLAHAGPLHCAPIAPDPLTLATATGAAHRAGCEAASGDDWRHLTTENTARDWELVRQALGEERISIHGLSYGTLLGSTYATLFPQHTDKMVLDSAANPDWMWNEVLAQQNEPYKQRVHAMFDWIAANDATYGLGDTPLKVYQRWTEQVLAETGTTATLAPPPAQVGDVPSEWQALAQPWMDGTTLTGPARVQLEGLARQLATPGAVQANSPTLAATRGVAPQSAAWPMLAAALRDGEPVGMGAGDPQMPAMPEEAIIALNMQSAMLCNENRVAPRPLDYPGFLWTQFVTGDIFDATGLMFSSGAACAGAPAVTTPVALSGDALETRPLLINSVGDPQTPMHGALALADRMGAHVLTVDGGDHGQVAKGNTVVDDAVVEYLRTGHTGVTHAPAPPMPAAS